MFEARFDENTNSLEIYNISQYPYEINAPVKMDTESKEYDKIFTDLGLNVLKPINDGEDFIYTYVGTSIAKGNLYSFDSLIGRSFGDVYPYFKEYSFPIFREVLETGNRRDISIYFYENEEIVICIELKVLLHEEEIFFFMENKTEFYELKSREKNNFELSTLPKSIVQNNRIVKINRAHELLTNVPIEEANKLTTDDFNKHKIVYNDTGLVLNYSQIMEKVLTNEYHQIVYNMVVDTYEKPKRLQGIARRIIFEGAPAIEFTVLKELEEFDAELNEFTQGKMDLIQKISKTAFLIYDVETDSSTWGKSLEYILEGSIKNTDDIKNNFYKILSEGNIDELNEVYEKMKNGDSSIEGELKTKTLKGNIKYLRYNLKPLYEDGKIVKWLQILTDITEDVMKNVELNTLKDVVDDVQEATSIAIFYMKDDGKYYWTSEIYKMIEREARPDDINHHILLDLISDEDKDKYYELIENLAPNKFLGTNIFTITLESGKTKFIEMNARKIYDGFGNFIRRVEYGRDITEDYLIQQELLSLNATVEDVQEAASVSIHYKKANGEHIWTPETYKIIEREPRDDDKFNHIILDLASSEDQDKFNTLFDSLRPNEFLGAHNLTITCENGNVKYLQIDSKKLYDEEGNFIQKSGYAMDITEEVLRNMELLKLNATVDDVQEAAAISINYQDANGEYVWTPGTYKLIEREPREEDKYSHIILDLASPEDKKEHENMFNHLKPNEFLGTHSLTITCENGKVKHLHVDTKKLYDDKGNFIQQSGYARDVTEEVLKNKEIERLNATVEDVQEAATISVHYKDSEGIHHWTPTTYKLIEREPREEDKYNNIIVDLASPEDQELHKEMTDKLKPNEFLGAHDLKITLENGKIKHLQVDTRKFYDENGNFVQQSAYAMDVTEEWTHEHDLIRADAEKTVLVKEVHHRVKNNLQVISSLISLEEKFKTDADIIIEITKTRINALALIHETIYNESDMNYINIKSFFEEFDDKLKALAPHPDIEFVKDIEDLTLSVNSVTPLVLMINELTTNSFKYAFDKEDNKEIFKSIHLFEDKGNKMCKFHYKDNGKGLDEGFDIDSSRSLGWTIIKSLTAQLEGEYELFNDNGFNFILKFPILE